MAGYNRLKASSLNGIQLKFTKTIKYLNVIKLTCNIRLTMLLPKLQKLLGFAADALETKYLKKVKDCAIPTLNSYRLR